ncbi:LPS export ABC transporter permease LptG [Caenispirillum bisanense]|uniref:Lipopolysaccharide export system permease protein n=1 Tax=Caenispirillum bisanense TaxID=414052 RepID=A0A286GII6_9PROT|nr:LPS export ABC transporter permease LptG [Caenispirillum bisanense]SOD94784.1 lipopolysaccharide export system permease protein [Caenispirillum bisanense]
MFRIYPTLSRYVTRHFLGAFTGTLLVIAGLIVLFDLIELLRRAAGTGTPAGELVVMALLKLPNMIHTTLPFVVLVAAMITFWRMARSSELVVMRSSGVSAWQFLAPIVLVTALIGVIEITVMNPVGARLYARFQAMEQDFKLSDDAGALNFSGGGMWLRESGPGERTAILRAGLVRQEDFTLKMGRISVFELKDENHFIRRIEADRATLGDGVLKLQDAWVMVPGLPSRKLDAMELPTTLTIGRIQEKYAQPESVPFWELPDFIAFFESAGFSAHRHTIYWHSLLASPLLLASMVLVAAVFTINPNLRSGKLLFRVLGGVMAGFGLYFYSKVTYALGLSDTLPLALAAWSPAAVTALLGTAFLFHLEDG